MSGPSRSRLAALALALASLLALAPAAHALPRLQAVADPQDGGYIADDQGREVLLRGVNVTSLAAMWKASAMPSRMAFRSSDADQVAGMGFDVVRLAVSWSKIEPTPGRYDERYIATIEHRIEMLAARGIYTIVDLHQDAWGATLVAAPDQVCAVGTKPALGWSGAPGWATLDEGAARCAGATREFAPSVRSAWTSFFTDAPADDGVGVQTRYLAMLEHVARRFAGTDALAGIDVMNEPGAMTSEQSAALAPFYEKAIAAIRRGERAGGGFAHMVILQPSVLWGLTWSGRPLRLADARGVVYSPHVFGQPSPQPYRNARKEARSLGGAPVLAGEWGANPAAAGTGEDGTIPLQQRLQDQTRTSAAFWTWKQSCGDPDSVLHMRERGDTWRPWSVFEMDCRKGRNTLVGPYDAVVTDLARGYVQAAPGRLTSTRWRYRVLRAAGRGAQPGGAPVVAYYPGAARPMVAVRGTEQARITRRGRGGWTIEARPTGGAWTLQAYARGDG